MIFCVLKSRKIGTSLNSYDFKDNVATSVIQNIRNSTNTNEVYDTTVIFRRLLRATQCSCTLTVSDTFRSVVLPVAGCAVYFVSLVGVLVFSHCIRIQGFIAVFTGEAPPFVVRPTGRNYLLIRVHALVASLTFFTSSPLWHIDFL